MFRDPKVDKEAAWAAYDEIRHCNDHGIPWDLRRQIFEAQNWRCCYCGVRMASLLKGAEENQDLYAQQFGYARYLGKVLEGRSASIEHIVKQADRLDHSRGNLVGACRWCNSARGDWPAEEWFDQVMFLKMVGQHPHFNTERGLKLAKATKRNQDLMMRAQ
jgi:hypothetical protein